MANPNDAVGTNGAFGGRTSVNAFNDVLSAFSGRGILSGWACSPSSGLTVVLGGDGNNRDVAIAEDASGNKTTIDNISQLPVQVTLNAAPASNSRIDAIVAYVEDSPQGSGITDNPDVANLLVVSGTVASSPIPPSDNLIRSAITADGASGSTAYYVIIAAVTVAAGTTDIDSTMIIAGDKVKLTASLVNTNSIEDNAITANKLGLSYSTQIQETGYTWIDGSKIYKKTLVSNVASRKVVIDHGVNLNMPIKVEGIWSIDGNTFEPITRLAVDQATKVYDVGVGDINDTNLTFQIGSGFNIGGTVYITLYYV